MQTGAAHRVPAFSPVVRLHWQVQLVELMHQDDDDEEEMVPEPEEPEDFVAPPVVPGAIVDADQSLDGEATHTVVQVPERRANRAG